MCLSCDLFVIEKSQQLSQAASSLAILGVMFFVITMLYLHLIDNLLNSWNFLEQMLSKNYQVLDVYYAVSPGHRTYITQLIIRTHLVTIANDIELGSPFK